MISLDNDILVKDLKSLLKLDEESLNDLIKKEEIGDLKFVCPEKYISNSDKLIYKSGFLIGFLRHIYPEKNNNHLVSILQIRYEMYVSWRQLLRRLKKFKELN